MKKTTFHFGKAPKADTAAKKAAEAVKERATAIRDTISATQDKIQEHEDAGLAIEREMTILATSLEAARNDTRTDALRLDLATRLFGVVTPDRITDACHAANSALRDLRRACRDATEITTLDDAQEDLDNAMRELSRVKTKVEGDFTAAKTQIEALTAALAAAPDASAAPAGMSDVSSALAAHTKYAAWKAAGYPPLEDAKGHAVYFRVIIGNIDCPLELARATIEQIQNSVPGYDDKGVFVPVKTGEAETLKSLVAMRKIDEATLWRTRTP